MFIRLPNGRRIKHRRKTNYFYYKNNKLYKHSEDIFGWVPVVCEAHVPKKR
ncbi:hypothetical protein JCM10003_3188 [Bacteroides pyogenes JCM 10003]|nr:hypothetical protein JCM10003_3188 [Bacteroides pyogenes JCM 10003]